MKQMLKACSCFALAIALSYAVWNRAYDDSQELAMQQEQSIQ